MRIGALGSLGASEATSQATRIADGRAIVQVGGHVVLQAAFIAPGLALFGVRGWRLAAAALGGSASFTLLSWLWGEVNGFSMLPMTAANARARVEQDQIPPRRQATPASAPTAGLGAGGDVIDISPSHDR
jgi:hypothetical protein